MVIFFENNGDCEKDAGKFVKIMRIVTAPALLSQDQQLPRIPLSDDRNFFTANFKKLRRTNLKQVCKPQSYASSKLQHVDPVTDGGEVKSFKHLAKNKKKQARKLQATLPSPKLLPTDLLTR